MCHICSINNKNFYFTFRKKNNVNREIIPRYKTNAQNMKLIDDIALEMILFVVLSFRLSERVYSRHTRLVFDTLLMCNYLNHNKSVFRRTSMTSLPNNV